MPTICSLFQWKKKNSSLLRVSRINAMNIKAEWMTLSVLSLIHLLTEELLASHWQGHLDEEQL